MTRTKLAVIVALMFATAACVGGEGSSEETTSDSSVADDTTTSGVPEDDGGETLADFFGYAEDDQEAAEARYRDEEARVQEAVRVCMVAQGFEYIPVQPPEGAFSFAETSEEEYAAEFGFGISTWVGNEDAFGGPDEEWEDPNQAVVEAMSEGEQEAYYEALYGTPEEQEAEMTVEVDPETGDEIYMQDGFGVGCQGEAYEEVYGSQGDVNALWEELQPDMDAMYQRIQADPRIADLNGEWSGCMAGKGFDYESQDVMYQTVFEDFQARLDEIVGPDGGYVDPFDGWSEEEIEAFFAEKTQEEIDAFFEEANNTPVDYDQTALAALQQEEIDLAVAAAQCSAGYYEQYQEVAGDYEAEFIASHRDQLESIRQSQSG
jgi:hypothetical protein